jgi:hypothetical protein
VRRQVARGSALGLFLFPNLTGKGVTGVSVIKHSEKLWLVYDEFGRYVTSFDHEPTHEERRALRD